MSPVLCCQILDLLLIYPMVFVGLMEVVHLLGQICLVLSDPDWWTGFGLGLRFGRKSAYFLADWRLSCLRVWVGLALLSC